jgi:hypothetical protein
LCDFQNEINLRGGGSGSAARTEKSEIEIHFENCAVMTRRASAETNELGKSFVFGLFFRG